MVLCGVWTQQRDKPTFPPPCCCCCCFFFFFFNIRLLSLSLSLSPCASSLSQTIPTNHSVLPLTITFSSSSFLSLLLCLFISSTLLQRCCCCFRHRSTLQQQHTPSLPTECKTLFKFQTMQETLLTLSHSHSHSHSHQDNIHNHQTAKKKKSQQQQNKQPSDNPVLPSPPPRTSRRVSPTVSPPPPPPPPSTALPNGDIYTGTLSGNAPHGTGKYLWSDGCMYEGDWRKGKACGKGRFSWPSGATYEGEFKSGRIEGFGSFIGVDGDMYRGYWLSDRKHGFGEKRYGNGDVYEGWWRCNLQDGQGRYTWKNGNEYIGEWKNGAICGKGVLVSENGNRYEGFWENGVPKGNNREGGFGFCEEEEEEEKQCQRKRSSVDATSYNSKGVSFPRICIWELDGEAGDITCDIVHNVEPSVFYKDGESENTSGESFGVLQKSPCWSVDGTEVKKPGQTVSKGHKNYDLMLSLQLGIRYTVGKYASIVRELRPGDFDPKEKFWTRLPLEGSKSSLPNQSVEFRWKDYCPMVFRHLRELFAIDLVDYMLAICGSDALREMSSPGKSGSIFYLTQDDRFIIKTVKKSEVKVLIRMLPSYYQHVCQYKNTLVTAFLGAHCIKPVGGQKIRFIVMGNVFCSEYRIHKRFDLKGSSHGRITDKPREEIDETTTLKDLDLNFVFRLEQSWFQELKWQLDRDCEFLEAEGIMDYSLLIGLHFRDDSSADDDMESPSHDLHLGKREMHGDEMRLCRGPLIRLGMNMPARAERVCKAGLEQHTGSGAPSENTATTTSGSEISDVILYFGIIDILQDYDISKRIEHAYKSLQVDPTSISAVDPKLYSKRFRDFIQRIFVEDK